ncbi:phosphoribosylaminoimidazole-succinocarboxamide synthase [Phaffia rhodozyma]|uniref:Phosphoribosylaminoimidazole-succinocarboxamide synthase n=1 Tax=Phaffia rhodozyma TaxID=264483 RepID=A0A0F7SQB5_PHARH|nr:phosphoribosylaminoimidazole-succinocarboxamide synthase [Phaffia rhodozyma]
MIETNCPDLTLIARGKVRDIYSIPDDDSTLLFVATDRISAYDVILGNSIPEKGKLLTNLSLFWFDKLGSIIPNHLVLPRPSAAPSSGSFDDFPASVQKYRDQLEGRSMIVKKCEVIKIEAIVRGYITGSGWAEYKKSGTVHGIQLPKGLVESQKLPEALFTPSTKADQGDHDENIHPSKVTEMYGPQLAAEIERVAVALYTTAAKHAESVGLILADTKFEFGLLPNPADPSSPGQLILIDEVLTPDSSRYWSLAAYAPGGPQESFDKQFLRDWLVAEGKKGVDGVTLPEDIVSRTAGRYREAFERVTGVKFE